jgi:hypothetical protein
MLCLGYLRSSTTIHLIRWIVHRHRIIRYDALVDPRTPGNLSSDNCCKNMSAFSDRYVVIHERRQGAGYEDGNPTPPPPVIIVITFASQVRDPSPRGAEHVVSPRVPSRDHERDHVPISHNVPICVAGRCVRPRVVMRRAVRPPSYAIVRNDDGRWRRRRWWRDRDDRQRRQGEDDGDER